MSFIAFVSWFLWSSSLSLFQHCICSCFDIISVNGPLQFRVKYMPLFYITPVTQLKKCEGCFSKSELITKCFFVHLLGGSSLCVNKWHCRGLLHTDSLMGRSLKKRGASALSRGFGAADWPLCQPVRANISAESLPTVFLIRFWQSCCVKQQHSYKPILNIVCCGFNSCLGVQYIVWRATKAWVTWIYRHLNNSQFPFLFIVFSGSVSNMCSCLVISNTYS